MARTLRTVVPAFGAATRMLSSFFASRHGISASSRSDAAVAIASRAEVVPPARIGPNAVLQTLRALREREPAEVSARVALRAELPALLPAGMIPEAWFVRLLVAVRDELSPERAEAVLRLSGAYTAAYVGQNRIPAPVRGLLAVTPERLALPMLLSAFRRHAWTFAGAGRFDVDEARYPSTIVLDGAPTCRREAARAVAPGRLTGAYYEAAFEGLLRLAAPHARVREVACQSGSAAFCRFEITLNTKAARFARAGEPACASS